MVRTPFARFGFQKIHRQIRLTGRSSDGAGVWQAPATADCRLAIVVKRWMLADSRLKINPCAASGRTIAPCTDRF